MLVYPHINPVAFSLFGINIYWYGLMYVIGIMYFLYMGKWRLHKYNYPYINNLIIDDIFVYASIMMLIGGRLGFCLLYQPSQLFKNPLYLFAIREGGMSFHGAMLGIGLALYLVAKKHKIKFWTITDFVSPLVPVPLFLGRIGNFINGELIGRVATHKLPWLMIFPQSQVLLPRHPSQLYEALGEGVLLFLIVWFYAKKERSIGRTTGIFLLSYGIIRFSLEFFREPDSFAMWVVDLLGLSLGQIYSIPIIILGLYLFFRK